MGWLSRIEFECVSAVRSGEQAEREQQCECAEARHHQIDIARAHVLFDLVVRHHQRPRRKRHELPTEQEGEGVVGEDDEVHPGEEERVEGQNPLRRVLMPAIAERVEARHRGPEIDHHQEEGGQRIEPEMCADPRQAHRQDQGLGGRLAEKSGERGGERASGDRKRAPIDENAAEGGSVQRERKRREHDQNGDQGENDGKGHL